MGIIYQGDEGNINVNRLFLSSKDRQGDIEVRALTSGTVWSAQGQAVTYNSEVTTRQLERSESGGVYTNADAVGIVELSLPNPQGSGIFFTFIRVAAFAFRVNPQNNDAIIYSNGQMSDGEYLELGSTGAKLSLLSDSNNNWIAIDEFGTLTEETP